MYNKKNKYVERSPNSMKKTVTAIVIAIAALLCLTATAVAMRYIFPSEEYPSLRSFCERIEAESPQEEAQQTYVVDQANAYEIPADQGWANRMYDVPEEVLSAPTDELLDYFLDSYYMQYRIAAPALWSSPRVEEEPDYTENKAFAELVSRKDFLDCLEKYAKFLPADCEIEGMTAPGNALAKILKQPSVAELMKTK